MKGIQLLSAAVALCLSACSGGGSSPIPAQTTQQAANGTTPVQFNIKLPAKTTSSSSLPTAKRPAYISTSTVTAAIAISQTGTATTNSTITCSSTACSGSVIAPFGIDTFAVTLEDGSGKALSVGSTTATILNNQANTVNLTFDPVLYSLSIEQQIGPFGQPFTSPVVASPGITSNTSIAVIAYDADGNIIVGPGSFVDSSGNPNPVTLALTGSGAGSGPLNG
ncbi:MAG: hypothetical protein ACYDA1_10430, partial [Vulcanimicrobiaceae bacterium]